MLRISMLFLLLLGSAVADEIEDQIQMGLESYQSKEYKMAIEDLNYAIAKLQEKLNTQNALLLPEALDGWSATEVENNSAAMGMLGGGTQMSRTYTRGKERLQISLMSGAMVASGLAMISNPMLLGNSPEMKPYRYKRLKGMIKHSDREVEVTLSIAGQILVQASVSGAKDDAAIKAYFDAMDFNKIKKALLQ